MVSERDTIAISIIFIIVSSNFARFGLEFGKCMLKAINLLSARFFAKDKKGLSQEIELIIDAAILMILCFAQ
jgi:hypothetical protein